METEEGGGFWAGQKERGKGREGGRAPQRSFCRVGSTQWAISSTLRCAVTLAHWPSLVRMCTKAQCFSWSTGGMEEERKSDTREWRRRGREKEIGMSPYAHYPSSTQVIHIQLTRRDDWALGASQWTSICCPPAYGEGDTMQVVLGFPADCLLHVMGCPPCLTVLWRL